MTVGPNKSGESYGGNRCLNNDYIIKPFKGNVIIKYGVILSTIPCTSIAIHTEICLEKVMSYDRLPQHSYHLDQLLCVK